MLKGGLPTATTYYKKHKISKGETIAQSLKERFDYGQNPDKTEGGELISSYGCDHMTADAEFLLSKAKYKAVTGREQRRDADVLCYQIRQSFKPGEITPEEAREILRRSPGVQLADDPQNKVYPMPVDATEKYDVLVGRIRQDISRDDKRGLDIFVSGDQLLKGAALNAVQIAELL